MAFSDKKFADSYSFFERSSESGRIIEKYPDRIPVICERNSHDISSPYIDKNKYLVPIGGVTQLIWFHKYIQILIFILTL